MELLASHAASLAYPAAAQCGKATNYWTNETIRILVITKRWLELEKSILGGENLRKNSVFCTKISSNFTNSLPHTCHI